MLAVEETAAGGGSSHSYWFFYDANGNVGQLIRASDRSLAAHYEYDPYGNTIVATGPDGGVLARANPFRFSTKHYDAELDAPGTSAAEGLYYYGYRYYSPRLARWLSRDPIEENGRLNLSCFVASAPPCSVDAVGLQRVTAAMCREACKRARFPDNICRAICSKLKNASCCGLEGLCHHIARHPSQFPGKKQAVEASG